MNNRLSSITLLLALLCSSTGLLAGEKPTPPVFSPSAAPCPPGATTLCLPLDASFSVVTFDGVGGNGPADSGDPCQRNDDDVTTSIALPFTFTLYGTPYTSLFINNNGNVSFGGPYDTYTPEGFPVDGFPMVAPLWSDVDTRDSAPGVNAGGVVYYKLEANRLTVIWDHVGYYANHDDLLNTFELIISDGTDPLVGIGRNVCFCYDDMQWTTGDASDGIDGFGGVPATAGINKGDGVAFALLGRFDHEGTDYDGPVGALDGISFLDGKSFCFNASGNNPVPMESTTWGDIKTRVGGFR